jgi:GPH family glycoside/pentoside/hexuronide:cation symporter
MPPVGHEHWLNAVHAFVFIQGYFILYGVIVTPYLALMPEITSDLKERVDLTTAQSIFMVIATVLFTLAGIVLENYGWFAFAAGAALLIVVFFLPAVFRLKEAPTQAAAPEDNLSYLQSLWLAFRNRPCRYVIFSTALYWFGLNGMIALVPHWTIRYLGRTEEDVTKLMVPFVVVNVIFFFVFNALAPKVGKYRLMLATFLGSGLVMMSLCHVGDIPFGSDFAQSVVVFALFAAPVAGFMVLPFAVLGDVIDNDAQQTGRRREAIFFGVQGIFQKTMIGVSIMTFTTVTTIGGQGGATPFGLKLMAFLCGLSCIAAFFLFLGYPLREDRGRAIMQGQS